MASYRYRRRADTRFAVSAVLAGALLAALVAHNRPGGVTADTVAAGGAARTSATSSNVALGQQLASADGWTGSQWSCLNALWTRESSWETDADNASSGAYGIPQSLPANKTAAAGATT